MYFFIRQRFFFFAGGTLRSIKANCTLILKSANSKKLYGELSVHDNFEKTFRSRVATLGELCNAEEEQNDQQTCIKISEWVPSQWIQVLSFLLIAFFAYFGPLVVCRFSPTEEIHQGVRQITVNSPSWKGGGERWSFCL